MSPRGGRVRLYYGEPPGHHDDRIAIRPGRGRLMRTTTATRALDRRAFLATAAGAVGATLGTTGAAQEGAAAREGFPICAFVKFIQDLGHERLAGTIRELGFDGIEATVRPGGQIEPERVEDGLPRLVEALKGHEVDLTIMTTRIGRADDPLTEKVLRTAAGLGVTCYRMDQYRYDLSRPVVDQIEALRPVVRELAALNRELGIRSVYQNHAGAQYVGATLWDLHALLGDIPPGEIGVAFDIRHATVEGGLAWPVHWNLMQPRAQAVFVKDFGWDGRRVENVPLGRGQVDPAFFERLPRTGFRGPISLHVEYLEGAGTDANVAALGADLRTLRRLLGG